MVSELFTTQTPAVFLIVTLAALLVLGTIELFALYLRVAGFTIGEIILMVAVPLFIYLTFLPSVIGAPSDRIGTAGAVSDVVRLFDVPLFRYDNATVGINLVGFSIPITISLKMLLQKRIPFKEAWLLTAIIAGVTFLYTRFSPEVGMVIHFFPILPILAAAIAFMLRLAKTSEFNPALVSYAGATMGVLLGADINNLYRALAHQWSEPVFISIGGGGVLDAVFLAGIVALGADVIFRSQNEKALLDNSLRLLFGRRKKD